MKVTSTAKFKETEIGPIPEEWNEFKISDLTEKVIDNRGKTPPLTQDGYELLEVNAIKSGNRTPDYSEIEKFVDEITYKNWFRGGHIKKGDLIIPTVGTIGNIAISLEDRGSIAQNLIGLRFNYRAEPSFIYYLLSSPEYKEKILNLDIGGVQPSVKVPHLLNLEIAIPQLNEQKQIAEILSSLDDKIELNLKMNNNLEKLASALFKKWFVDIGDELPEGWRIVPMREVLELNYGKALKAEDRKEGRVKVYGSSGFVGFHDVKLVDGPGIIVGRKGNVGSVFWSDGGFYAIDTTYYVKSKLPLSYCFYLLKNQTFVNGDSVVPGLNRDQAYRTEVVLPNTDALEKFDAIASELRKSITLIEYEIELLSVMRDSLLSRLMSGKIRISQGI